MPYYYLVVIFGNVEEGDVEGVLVLLLHFRPALFLSWRLVDLLHVFDDRLRRLDSSTRSHGALNEWSILLDVVRQVLPFNARAYRGSEIHEVEELLEHCDHQVELPVGEELSNRRLVILDKNIRRFVVWPVEANWSVKCYLIFND